MRNLLIFMLLVGIFVFSRNGIHFSLFSAFSDGVKGTGPVQTETRSIGSFKKLNMGIAGDVEFSISDQYSVTVQAQGNLLPLLKTYVDGETLQIRFEKNVHSEEPIIVKITAPSIEDMDLSGSGNIRSLTPIKGAKLKLDITGSGNIDIPQADVNELECGVGGSGELKIAGTARQVHAGVGGSGSIDSRNLSTDVMDVNITGSGQIQCNVVQSLKASVSGSGEVYYRGNPQVDSRISGSGSVEKID